jgi:hypothetical protein
MSHLRDRPLWTCPRCGARLVGRNMSHACGDYSVEKFLAGKGARARAMYERFAELVSSCGPLTLAPAKTRVAFMVRMRFCAVERVSEVPLDGRAAALRPRLRFRAVIATGLLPADCRGGARSTAVGP